MQDLREDLQEGIESALNALNDIEDIETRKLCQSIVRVVIKDVIKRIDSELLETEKQQIFDSVKYTLEQCDTPRKGSLNDFFEEVYNQVTKKP